MDGVDEGVYGDFGLKFSKALNEQGFSPRFWRAALIRSWFWSHSLCRSSSVTREAITLSSLRSSSENFYECLVLPQFL